MTFLAEGCISLSVAHKASGPFSVKTRKDTKSTSDVSHEYLARHQPRRPGTECCTDLHEEANSSELADEAELADPDHVPAGPDCR